MTTLTKICGLSTADALDAALAEHADFVGFVFFPPSPRNVPLDLARDLGTLVQGRAHKVALTVDADDAFHAAIVEAIKPDALQLHGQETAERVVALKERFGLPVIKAMPVGTRDDLGAVAAYAGVADWLLFDARAPKDATRPGGHGNTFDWTLLKNLDPRLRFMLSGGLGPGNVGQALAMTGAPAVDVSSGVEVRPGVKDPSKIADFIRAVREADAARVGAASSV